jgi:hypothetical protein
MEHTSPVWLVVNAASGSNNPEAVETVTAALAKVGHAPARIVTIPDDDLPDRATLESGGVGILAIFTGDGTANAQLALVQGWGGQVLVLPGGTQNLLAKSLHGETAAPDIAVRLPALVPIRLRMVRTSQGDALCEVLAGPGATWSDVREEIRDGTLGGIAATLGEALRQTTSGPAVKVVEPHIGRDEGYPALRLYPGTREMAVDGYGAQDLTEMAQQGIAILRRDFRTGPHDQLGEHPRVTCRSEQPIELMIDGERSTGSREESFQVVDCDVDFLSSAGRPDND